MEVSSDSSDSDSDMQAPYQSVPPPPAHIPRPRGGAGPPLTPRKQGAPSREVGRASFDSPSQEDSFALMVNFCYTQRHDVDRSFSKFKGINTLGDQVGKLCELVSNGRMSNRTGHSPRSSPAISRVFKVPVDRSREEGRTEALVSIIILSSEFSLQADTSSGRNFVGPMLGRSSRSSTTKIS